MQNDTGKRKRPWLAALLTILAPGLGHAYLKQWSRAVLWLLLVLGSWVILLPDLLIVGSLGEVTTVTEEASTVENVALAGISALCIVDAYWMATHQNRKSASRTESRPSAADTAEAEQTGTDSDTEAEPTTGTETGGTVAQCPNCGKEIDSELDFCHWCTTPLERTE